jgi:hypothetical protein
MLFVVEPVAATTMPETEMLQVVGTLAAQARTQAFLSLAMVPA